MNEHELKNCTAYFLDAQALLLTERVIVLCVYAAHTCSFNYKSDYSKHFFCLLQVFLDMTFGAGGHTEVILQHCDTCRVLALDRDPVAYELATKMADQYG